MSPEQKRAPFVRCSRGLLLVVLLFCHPLAGRAASLAARADVLRNDCTASSSDPNCVGGQVLNDPLLAPDIQNAPSASAGQQLAAAKSYTDPQIGTTDSASSQATAGFGVLRASATAAVSSSPPLGYSSPYLVQLTGLASASFSDTVTIHPGNPLLIGTAGTYTGSLVIDGSLDGSVVNIVPGRGGAAANWIVGIWSGSSSFGGSFSDPNFFGSESYNSGAPTYVSGLGDAGEVTFTVPFVFGTPFALGASLRTVALGRISSGNVQPLTNGITTATATALYGNTVTWGGISAVRSGSNLVSDFSVSSASGVDYALPIPEPSTLLLVGGGLAALGLARRRADAGTPVN